MRRFLFIILASFIGCAIGVASRHLFHAKASKVAPDGVAERDAQHAPATVADATAPATVLKEAPYPTGYAVKGKKVFVQMSDGTVRTEQDKELESVRRNSITIAGKKLFFKPAPRLSMASAQQVPQNPANAAQPAPVVDSHPAPPEPPASSWVENSDGVSRLVAAPVIAH